MAVGYRSARGLGALSCSGEVLIPCGVSGIYINKYLEPLSENTPIISSDCLHCFLEHTAALIRAALHSIPWHY